MRLTSVLCKHNYHRLIKKLWKRGSRMQINELSIPPELEEMGVTIYNAKTLFMEANKQKVEDSLILNSYDLPEEKYYLFHQKTRMTEGLDQVLSLTKTVSYEGLPLRLNNLIGVEQIPDQDELVKNCINQSLLWDAWQVRLPKKIDVKTPGWVFPREYGVPLKRKVLNLLNKLVHLSEAGSGKYPESLKRSKVLNSNCELLINSRKDSVSFQLCSDILVTDKKPLQRFASAMEVEETKIKELPSMFPIKPTLDLDQCEACPIGEISSQQLPHTAIPKSYIHTLHVPHRSIGFFFPVQKLSRGIACCFTFAAEEARRLYGPNVKELLDPVSVQCIYMDVKTFGFLAYQLNTLDLENEEGIKNQVWIDGPHDLYEEVTDGGITNYNPEVFTKMLALSMNGVHPLSFK